MGRITQISYRGAFQGDREGRLDQPQGDREGRPYNTRYRVKRATSYCRGDPRGRPGEDSEALGISPKNT